MMHQSTKRGALLVTALCLLLPGCISFGGGKAPAQLLTLTSNEQPEPGRQRVATPAQALVIDIPTSDRLLDSVRVPVHINESAVAYVKDAVWAEKPARLFRGVLAETIAARGTYLVLEQVDTGSERGALLSGQLQRFGYDEGLGAVVVRYDAVLRLPGQPVRKQRFEATEDIAVVEATAVGAALNRASNKVAGDVAAWVLG